MIVGNIDLLLLLEQVERARCAIPHPLLEQVQQRFNPDLGIVGIVLTMFDRRNRLTDQVADDVRDCLGNLVFESVIPRNVRLSEAPSHGMPALIYDHNCTGSRAYIALARELIGRLPERRKAA